jgi:hypothetical protein
VLLVLRVVGRVSGCRIRVVLDPYRSRVCRYLSLFNLLAICGSNEKVHLQTICHVACILRSTVVLCNQVTGKQ